MSSPSLPPSSPVRGLLQDSGFDTEQQDFAIARLVQEARNNFLAYILLFNPPSSGYQLGDLHAYLAGLVQGVVDGTKGKRQAVSVPPQHGKSKTLSWEAASWVLGRKPGIEVAITAFALVTCAHNIFSLDGLLFRSKRD